MTNLLRKALLLSAIAYAASASAQTRADGLAAMQMEEWDKAISIYTALSKADPADQDALLTLSNAYLAKGDKAQALENAKAAFNAKSDAPLAFVANAKVLLLEGKSAEASEQFKRAASKAKKDINAHRQIGESYTYFIPQGSNRPDLTRAVELLTAALNVNSKDIPTLMALGYAYKEQGNGGMAAQQYELAEQLEPKNPLPKLMLAKVYKAAKLPAKFESYIDKTLGVAPNYTPALRAKAEHFYFGRQWEKAAQALKDLVSKGSEVNIEDEMLLANALYITKDCKACSELVDKILAKDPTKNYLRRLKAYCDYDNGEYQRGLNLLNDYFKTAPPDKIIASDYLYLGRLQLKTNGDTTAAVANLAKSIEMDSTTWPLWKEIAKLQYARRMNCEAAESFHRYYDSIPAPEANEAQDIYFMGLSHYFCKDDSLNFDKAELVFSKVTELMPQAGIGWWWAHKAAKYKDPSLEDIEADPTIALKYGHARKYLEPYVEIASADVEKNKKDLATAYQYLAYCYFVNNESDKFFPTADKWEKVETDAATLESIRQMREAFGKETIMPGSAPATTTPTPSGGGKGGRN